MTVYTKPRLGAIALGVICAAGAGAVLVEDARHAGPSLDHALSIIALIITIAAGHLAVSEFCAFRIVRAAALALVFAGGVLFCGVSTAGRNAEQQELKAAEAHAKNDRRSEKKKEVEVARLGASTTRALVTLECKSGSGPRCESTKQLLLSADATLARTEKDYWALGADVPVNAKLSAFAALVATVTRGDKAAIAGTLEIIWPYVLPVLLEIGSIVFWSMGLPRGHRAPKVTANDNKPTRAETPITAPVATPIRRAKVPAKRHTRGQPVREAEVKAFVADFRKTHGADPRTCEVSEALGLPKATASRWRAKAVA